MARPVASIPPVGPVEAACLAKASPLLEGSGGLRGARARGAERTRARCGTGIDRPLGGGLEGVRREARYNSVWGLRDRGCGRGYIKLTSIVQVNLVEMHRIDVRPIQWSQYK